MTQPGVSSEEYTQDYYTYHCQGYEEFSASRGEKLPLRLAIPFRFANIQPGMRVLDVGCGRGEVVYHAARQGARVWGIDYAEQAVKIARDMLDEALPAEAKALVTLQQCSATSLPFQDGSMDRVFMLDVVEHLYPTELHQAFSEVRRVLSPGGQLIIHTSPNLWYYRYGYPLYRAVQRLRGQRLPADPRERVAYRHLHVNEQTPVALSKALRACGFARTVRLIPTQDYRYEANRLVRFGMLFLTRVYPFRWIFSDDIFAIAAKK